MEKIAIKRPIGVWIACGVATVLFSQTLFSLVYVMPLGLTLKMAPQVALGLSLGVLEMTGVIFFFLMKRRAVEILGACAVIFLGSTLWQIFTTNLTAHVSVFTLILQNGWFVGVFAYSFFLRQRGLLS